METRHKNQPEAKSPEACALGARFRETRKAKGIPLVQMAEQMGRSINTIRWHESGDTMLRADDAVKAAGILDVTPGFLLGEQAREDG